MPRAIWSGGISFGLVNVPVKAYPATRDHAVHFHQVDGKGTRVRHQKVSEKTGRKVEEVKLAYERSNGKLVVFDQKELDELRPASTRTIDVGDFVDLDDIDPIYYRTTYWLGPDGDAAKRPYTLLLRAMDDQQKVGIGSVVMRNKQYLTAVRPLDGVLAMSTMRFADEILDKSDIDGVPSRLPKVDAKELKLANQIIDSLGSEWKPNRYHDTYTEVLRDLIERKAEGATIEVETPDEGKADVVDLMAALEASVNKAKRSRAKRPTKKSA